MSSSSPERPRSLKRLSQKRTVAPHSPILAAIPGALSPSTACWMICARRTSPAPSFCERVIRAIIRASLGASSSRNARTRRVIATSPARTGTFTLELRVHPRPEPSLFLAPLQPLGEENLAHPAALHADALLAQVGHPAVQGPRRERQAQLGGPRQRRSDNRAALLGGVGRRPPRAHLLLQPREA